MDIFIVTAIGVGIDTEAHVAYSKDEACDIIFQLIDDFRIDRKEISEMTSVCWKGYSPKANCDIEFEIHDKRIKTN